MELVWVVNIKYKMCHILFSRFNRVKTVLAGWNLNKKTCKSVIFNIHCLAIQNPTFFSTKIPNLNLHGLDLLYGHGSAITQRLSNCKWQIFVLSCLVKRSVATLYTKQPGIYITTETSDHISERCKESIHTFDIYNNITEFTTSSNPLLYP
jgi:hypothetical protein